MQPNAEPHPLSLPGKSSQLLFAEFELASGGIRPTWKTGRDEVRMVGWVNTASRKESPKLDSSVFHFLLTDEIARRLASDRPSTPTLLTVPIEEWSPGRSQSSSRLRENDS